MNDCNVSFAFSKFYCDTRRSHEALVAVLREDLGDFSAADFVEKQEIIRDVTASWCFSVEDQAIYRNRNRTASKKRTALAQVLRRKLDKLYSGLFSTKVRTQHLPFVECCLLSFP
jgi:hypothetical protein